MEDDVLYSKSSYGSIERAVLPNELNVSVYALVARLLTLHVNELALDVGVYATDVVEYSLDVAVHAFDVGGYALDVRLLAFASWLYALAGCLLTHAACKRRETVFLKFSCPFSLEEKEPKESSVSNAPL